MDWLGVLGLQGLAARWRTAATEGASALEDRVELARLEWAEHRNRLVLAALLLVVFGALAMVALLLLSLAILVQFWDSPERVTVAWLLAGVWLLGCIAVLVKLMSCMRQARNAFALTRRELAQDWRSLRERL